MLTIATHSLYGEEMMTKVGCLYLFLQLILLFKLVANLSDLTKVRSEEILVFARVIHDFTLETEPEPPVQAPPANLIGMQHIDISMLGYDLFE